jgi:hypothetical protein
LLDACGLETGIEKLRFVESARAGLEHRLVADQSPYVVKLPYLSEDLAGLIDGGFDPSTIDAILVPVRELDDAVASRIQLFMKKGHKAAGGLWRSQRPGLQRKILAESLHRLLMTAADHQIKLVLFTFPRFVNDSQYAWECLESVLPCVDKATFFQKHAELLRPELVSNLPHFGRIRMMTLDCSWAIQKLNAKRRRKVRRWRASRPWQWMRRLGEPRGATLTSSPSTVGPHDKP